MLSTNKKPISPIKRGFGAKFRERAQSLDQNFNQLRSGFDRNLKWLLRKPWIPRQDLFFNSQIYFLKLRFIVNAAKVLNNNTEAQGVLFKEFCLFCEEVYFQMKNFSDECRSCEYNFCDTESSSPLPPVNTSVDLYLIGTESPSLCSPTQMENQYSELFFFKKLQRPPPLDLSQLVDISAENETPCISRHSEYDRSIFS